MHKIHSITHKDGTPRTDGRYPLRVGCTVKILGCTKESPMAFGCIHDNTGNPKTGVLRTSTVQGISIDGDNLVVETMNSIYTFEEVREAVE